MRKIFSFLIYIAPFQILKVTLQVKQPQGRGVTGSWRCFRCLLRMSRVGCRSWVQTGGVMTLKALSWDGCEVWGVRWIRCWRTKESWMRYAVWGDWSINEERKHEGICRWAGGACRRPDWEPVKDDEGWGGEKTLQESPDSNALHLSRQEALKAWKKVHSLEMFFRWRRGGFGEARSWCRLTWECNWSWVQVCECVLMPQAEFLPVDLLWL